MAQVLVFGKNGQVATALKEQVSELGHESILPGGFPADEWLFLSSKEADFNNPDSIVDLLNLHKPLVVINAAGYTAVDKAETDKVPAMKINGVTPGHIAKWCYEHKVSLISYSTDYVFNGEGIVPWKEDDPVDPQNHYGLTKLQGEKQITESGCHHVILRTSWVYSPAGANFVRTILRLGNEREELKIVNDQVGSPTSALDIARATMEVMDHPGFRDHSLGGIYHLAGDGFVSWYEFAKEIIVRTRALGLRLIIKNVLPIPTADYPTPAKRPLNSRLDQSKIAKDFGWKSPSWQTSLEEVLEEIMVREAGR